jgi:hypothetical protein
MVETPIGKAPAARFEISIDGVPRSHRDQQDMAIQAAAQLMLKYPNSAVAVRTCNAARLPRLITRRPRGC